MTQTSNTINKIMNPPPKFVDMRTRRPFVKLDWYTFINAFLGIANEILAKRGIQRFYCFNDINKHIINQLFLYATLDAQCNLDLNKGIMLIGAVGAGKSILMESFLGIFNRSRTSNKIVTIMSAKGYVERLLDDKDNLSYITQKPLYLDDIGKEQVEVSKYGLCIQPISNLITQRYDNGSITYATSNYKLQTLSEYYGNYVGDRMREMFNVIHLEGSSLRK